MLVLELCLARIRQQEDKMKRLEEEKNRIFQEKDLQRRTLEERIEDMERAQGTNPSSLPLTQQVAEVHANRSRPQQTFNALDKGKGVATTSQFQRINLVIESRQDLNFNDRWQPTQTTLVYEDELDEGDEYIGEDDMYNEYKI